MGVDNDVKPVGIDPVLDFFAGTVAGMAALAVGFPFDTVKVRFQAAAEAHKYTSTFEALFTILRQERLTGIFRGIASPLLTAAPLNGLVFASYRLLMKAQLSSDDMIPTLTQVALAGAGSGIIATLITAPTELIKTQQQIFQSSASYSALPRRPLTARDVALQIFRTHGLSGLYRGITATALRDIGYGTYFGAYEATMRYWPRAPGQETAPWYAQLLAGALAGIAGWVVTFPFDVVKTRVQSTLGATPENPYRNTWSTIVASYRAEGLGVFFRGLAPTLIRAVPVNMVTFTTFEAIVHAFS
ncbi:mitochondrial carrier [Laetiporus sulphureus 93-53]|uniref:Mitochondrial carrier n=1 Tax=Laetiporus sulphureus 93-53 TaxID=1314785 RepID=A0A165EIU2_9APHY|nr:mitochondrial carrier [Laetiporus sulphureus 93-53]KZT07139.1 mitochondrial carrier [Laetiporus sulphureus 93-53]